LLTLTSFATSAITPGVRLGGRAVVIWWRRFSARFA
jgi:hypothetical protein